MKVSEILEETPYLHPGEMSRKMLDGSISIGAIQREYRLLDMVDNLLIYLSIDNTRVIGINSLENIVDRVLPVFKLIFKSSNLLKFRHQFQNIIQVDRVAVTTKAGSSGIMSRVYKMLVDRGFTLVSDITQFDPAQALWKKIATDPEYKVYVADIDHGIFRDEDGTGIVYNGTNLDDQDIWTRGGDYAGQYRVLILVK
jgi:hypothetical protein